MTTTTRKATGTIMGRKRPRSRPSSNRHPSAPAKSGRGKANEESEWGRLRRNRPLSVRPALLLLALLVLLAAGSDFALYTSVADHYRSPGHIGLPLDVTGMTLAFTALAVYACIPVRKEFRKNAASKHTQKHDTAADKPRIPRTPTCTSVRLEHTAALTLPIHSEFKPILSWGTPLIFVKTCS